MIKQISLFLILAISISSCCKKESINQTFCGEPTIVDSTCTLDSNQIKAQIIGKWNWTQSISSWTMQKTNPCTDSINRQYEFQTNGTVKYSENGTYKSTGTYFFESSSGFKIRANDTPSTFWLNGWVSICDNYLIIDDSPVDGPKDIYVKAN